MKRFSAALAACALIGSLVACGDSTGTSGGHDPEPGESSSSNGVGGSSSSTGSGNGASFASVASSRLTGWPAMSSAVHEMANGTVIELDGDSVRVRNRVERRVVSHDPVAHRLVVRNSGEGKCVYSDDGSVSWRIREPSHPLDTLAYVVSALSAENEALIVGDQGFEVRNHAVLCLGEQDEEYGMEYDVWVGGDGSSVYGVWDRAFCSCGEGLSLTCRSAAEISDVERDFASRMIVSADKVVEEILVAYPRETIYNDRPFVSRFMAALYAVLAEGVAAKYMTYLGMSSYLNAYEFFIADSAAVANRIADAGVVVKTQTADSQTFEMGGRRYTVRILEGSAAGVDFSADVEVSSGDAVCRITSRRIEEMNESLCDSKNLEDFEWGYSVGENLDVEVFAEGIDRNNGDEALECLNRIALVQTDLAANPAPAPDVRAEVSFRKALRRKLPFLPRQSPIY